MYALVPRAAIIKPPLLAPRGAVDAISAVVETMMGQRAPQVNTAVVTAVIVALTASATRHPSICSVLEYTLGLRHDIEHR